MKFYQTIIFITLSAQLSAQKVILYTNKHYAKYPLLDNSYIFYVPNIPCSNIVFKSKHGKIFQNGCRIYFSPDSLASTSFYVYKKFKAKLIFIDSINISVFENLDIQALFNYKLGGTISGKDALKAEGLLVKYYISEGHSEAMILRSYRVIAIRSDSSETALNEGGHFNEKVISIISKLKTGDKLIFADIKVLDWKYQEKYAAPLEFTIQ